MVTEIEKMSATSPVSEIAYLGWCYLTDAEKPPLCMHSYAVTVPAARMLLEVRIVEAIRWRGETRLGLRAHLYFSVVSSFISIYSCVHFPSPSILL